MIKGQFSIGTENDCNIIDEIVSSPISLPFSQNASNSTRESFAATRRQSNFNRRTASSRGSMVDGHYKSTLTPDVVESKPRESIIQKTLLIADNSSNITTIKENPSINYVSLIYYEYSFCSYFLKLSL
jgi:hypothetical protein